MQTSRLYFIITELIRNTNTNMGNIAQVIDNVNSLLPQANRIDLLENTLNIDLFNETNWFMPMLQLTLALLFLSMITFSSLHNWVRRMQVQRLEKKHFIRRGDVTLEFGRSTYGRTCEKMIWTCFKRRSITDPDGTQGQQETVRDLFKKMCQNFRKRHYWKMKLWQLLEISRSENTIIGIIWPVEDEAIYFNRTQRLFCYYCGTMVILCCFNHTMDLF